MTNLRERLNLLILELVAEQNITRGEAVARIRRPLGDAEGEAVADGNAEGFASDPEPNPDVLEGDEG